MRFTAFAAVLGLAAVASAQNSTSASPTTTALTPQQTCLAACGQSDICCQARCVNVPCPSELQANSTTDCAARCEQGDGSQEQTERYAQCQQACISSLFFPLSATPTPTAGSSGSAGGSGAATTTGGSGNGGSTSSRAGSATGTASPTTTPNAAPEVRFGTAGAGLVGLIVAALII